VYKKQIVQFICKRQIIRTSNINSTYKPSYKIEINCSNNFPLLKLRIAAPKRAIKQKNFSKRHVCLLHTNCTISFFQTVGLFLVSPEDESCLLLKGCVTGFVCGGRRWKHFRYMLWMTTDTAVSDVSRSDTATKSVPSFEHYSFPCQCHSTNAPQSPSSASCSLAEGQAGQIRWVGGGTAVEF
jgi:hypothetical protein